MSASEQGNIERFIQRWQQSGAAERANYAPFLSELCDILDLPRPDPKQPDEDKNTYVFEKPVTFHHPGSTRTRGRIDLYRLGCFVLEAKQGSSPVQLEAEVLTLTSEPGRRSSQPVRGTRRWDEAMIRAHGQARNYARALPEWPPFLLVVDVGFCIDLYSDFARMGKGYLPFPDPRSHRILIEDLKDSEVRETLRKVWLDPLSLDPSQYAARVTKKVAEGLAELGLSLEQTQDPKEVADFLMRCLFTMFAEDVGLLPADGFTDLLKKHRNNPQYLQPMIIALWREMDSGGFSVALGQMVLRFNGRFFKNPTALSLTSKQIDLLIKAADTDWSEVEPAIFGTLLERALDPKERHRLGAHYTPRAYVERLVLPTVLDPLRREWESIQAAAFTLLSQDNDAGKDGVEKRRKQAVKNVSDFHARLCDLRVLDPACGTGNFLYVTLDLLKRLEGEVLQALHELGETQTHFELEGITVNPGQFFGIEVNPRAASIAELVLWLGYLQWHFRTHGTVSPPEPVLTDYKNIENRDAVLAFDREEIATDESGGVITRWDGETFKTHPTTGEQVPDENARKPEYRYKDPRPAQWPEVDFIVGNPPFIGGWRMRDALGHGYTETLRRTYREVPESCDYVMYWWELAARRLRKSTSSQGEQRRLLRFGFISTNSISQTFSRKVVQPHLDAKDGISLALAIGDHPWVDVAEGADVRIAMTVAKCGRGKYGLMRRVASEEKREDRDAREVVFEEQYGLIHADLTVGVDVSRVMSLRANQALCSPGVKLHGAGFIVTPDQAESLGLGRVAGLEEHIRHYRNGRDITQVPRGVMVIDLFGLSDAEVRTRFPEVYQWVVERVKPGRDAKSDSSKDSAGYARLWWLFGKPRQEIRKALGGLERYIATVETAKHRFFVFLDQSILPDNMLVNIALEDAFYLGVLSSRIHVVWALKAGGRLGVGNDPRYNKTRCFDPFPFPDCSDEQRARIRELGEALDAHRKARQALHPKLTLTAMYNVQARLRDGEELTNKERAINDQGLCTVLRQIHDDLDQAVFDAYGWPANLNDQEILAHLVALNETRAREEASGTVRWLRPDFQDPSGSREPDQVSLSGVETMDAKPGKPKKRRPWPKGLVERVQVVQGVMTTLEGSVTPKDVARRFTRAKVKDVAAILATLAALGQVHELDDGRFIL